MKYSQYNKIIAKKSEWFYSEYWKNRNDSTFSPTKKWDRKTRYLYNDMRSGREGNKPLDIKYVKRSEDMKNKSKLIGYWNG